MGVLNLLTAVPRFDEPGVFFDDPLIRYDDPRSYQEILNSLNPSTAMFDVVVDLKDLTVPALISRVRAIITATSGEAAFSTLADKLTALGTKVDTLEADESALRAAENAVKTATDTRDDSLDDVMAAANELGVSIGMTATTEAQVNATLMRVKSGPKPKPIPNTPTGLELKMGDEDGELSGQCDGQPGVVEHYEIQYTTSDPLSSSPGWQFADTSRKSRFDLQGLPSGAKVWVRLRAVNARGKSGWSDPACKRVP